MYTFDLCNQRPLIFSANFYLIAGNISNYHSENNLQVLATLRNSIV